MWVSLFLHFFFSFRFLFSVSFLRSLFYIFLLFAGSSLHSHFSGMPARGRHAGWELKKYQIIIEFEYPRLPTIRNTFGKKPPSPLFAPYLFLLSFINFHFSVCCLFSLFSLFRDAGPRPACRLTVSNLGAADVN